MNEITLIRGDTETIKVGFFKDGESYKPTDVEDGDILTFTMRDTVKEKAVLVKKVILPDTTFKLTHEDTRWLEPGRYSFDLEYRKPDKSVVKTLLIGKVSVRRDVTYNDRY